MWPNIRYIQSCDHFVCLFRNIFNYPAEHKEAGEHLFTLKQGTSLATRSRWNEPALIAAFSCRLWQDVLTELTYHNSYSTLDNLINLVIQLDKLLKDRRHVATYLQTHWIHLHRTCMVQRLGSVDSRESYGVQHVLQNKKFFRVVGTW